MARNRDDELRERQGQEPVQQTAPARGPGDVQGGSAPPAPVPSPQAGMPRPVPPQGGMGPAGGPAPMGRVLPHYVPMSERGLQMPAQMPGQTAPAVLPIGEKEVAEALATLTRYKDGKANLEHRVVEDELWWELRHWEAIGRNGSRRAGSISSPGCDPGCAASSIDERARPKPTSAWLFNALLNKHADAMDNYPEPVVLPREQSDEQSAKILSEVLPVVLEQNEYEQTYSDNWWDKLKHGTAVYGVFWDPEKENGLGDINIKEIDLLKLFWEPGITDIQKSRNLFIVELVDEDLLEQQYPEHKGKLRGNSVDVKQYIYDDQVDTSGKAVVVDWYYKVKAPSGRTILHYAKLVGTELLFSSENDPQYRERGWYDHGLYPVVLDVLFPEKGTPVGFGYIAICKDPQLYIDKLSANILESAEQATNKRFWISDSTGVNEQEFLDQSKPLVHVQGELDERRIQEITLSPISSVYVEIMQLKIEEMKDTASNRDVNQGGTGSGVTAAAAIAALQEAGNKTSRDMIAASYRAHTAVNSMCIELMRQFYDEARSFRITGETPGSYQFVSMDNSQLRDQPVGMGMDGTVLYRRPVFDLKISSQKKNPFARMEQNERAKELYGLGFFNPERAQEAMGALQMMDFEGIDEVKGYVQQGQTLMNICQQMSRQLDQMAMIIQATTGTDMGVGAPGSAQGGGQAHSGGSAPQGDGRERQNINGQIMRAQTPMTGYGQRLAERSKPSMEGRSSEATPGR